jgi:hypothetical protein
VFADADTLFIISALYLAVPSPFRGI